MFHIIVKTERRISTKDKPRELAIVMNNDLRTLSGTNAMGLPTYTVTVRPPQLHTMGALKVGPDGSYDLTNTNILYAAEWNDSDPYITMLKGTLASINMAYAGWPMITKEQWLLENPPLITELGGA